MAVESQVKPVTGEGEPVKPERARLRGRLELDFRFDDASGRTVLVGGLQEPPLRVVRAFEREDGSALAHLHNVSGGILGGDHLILRARAGRGASAQLTTTGATRIYRARAGAPTAVQINEIAVGEDALLEYVPDPIIPFAGARFSQRTRIHLARGAGLFWWEILAPGREARGELFQYEQVEMTTHIEAEGRPIAAERIRLQPASRDPRSPARLGDYPYLVSFYICRAGLESGAWLAAEEELRQVAKAASGSGDTLWGISTLAADGIAVRGLARRGRDAAAGLHALWRAAKQRLFQRDIIPPRKMK